MSVLAQCGYGRGDKIELGLGTGVIKGVIMSPRDETRGRLENAISQFGRNRNAVVLFDPQFYAAALRTPRDGYLSDYDYYNNNNGLSRTNFSGSRIRQYVKECLDYQDQTFGDNISCLISPTILFDGFRDYWSQVALNMAVESADYHSTQLQDPQPLLVSIVVTETAFQQMDAMEEFLDALTEMDVQGFYIVIRRNATSVQNAIEPGSFGRFLYFAHVLAQINEYQVVVGYSDWHSFLMEAVGVAYTACGWYQNLRQFSLARYQPSTGGRRPRKRYSSAPLLSSVLIAPEMQDIYLARLMSRSLSGSPYDNILANGPSAGEPNWTEEVSCLTHWFSLSSIAQFISTQRNPLSRVQAAEDIIRRAITLYNQLERRGVTFEPQTGPGHIIEWQESLREFRGIAAI